MTWTVVAHRDGCKFFKGIDGNDRTLYAVQPASRTALPTQGFFNSYKACELRNVYNVFKLIEITK